MRLVLATANVGKQRELAALLAPRGCELILQSTLGIPSADETGHTFEANALLKARHAALGAGLPALADDSGLEVDALGGAPGVRSARYGANDAERIARLLSALTGRTGVDRRARFRCVVVMAWPDGRIVAGDGVCEGTISEHASGTHGFGYDPVFQSTELGCTFAEAPADAKARVSHRARAMRALGAALIAS